MFPYKFYALKESSPLRLNIDSNNNTEGKSTLCFAICFAELLHFSEWCTVSRYRKR
jgi:hypothetical protein